MKEMSVKPFKPPFIKRWNLTEGDECYEHDYDGPEYKNGKHRKYTAELSKDQFKRFIDDTGLIMQDIETLGSLTVEYGHLPAFSFDGDRYDYPELIWQNAYVTPFPEHVIKGKEFSEKRFNDCNWNRLKQAMLNMFG
jgi:hypothetical protein